jgi:alpha-1,2-mannosyltransferase
VGKTLLWVLACASVLLLAYEAWTLLVLVLRPLLSNPNAIQTDFHYYYDAARRFTADRQRLYQLSDDVIAGFAYPPPAIVPFMWLARWPLGTALLAWTIISYLMILVASQQWLKYLRANGHVIDRNTAIAAGLVAFAIGPTYMNAIFGQVNGFVLASAVAFVRLAPVAAMEAGILLALGTWLKIYPAFLAVIGLWDRRTWKAIGWTIAFGIVIALVFLPVVSLPTYRTFLFDVLARRIDKTAIQITNQSLVAFIERFRFAPDFYTYWTGQEAVTVSTLGAAINLAFAAIAAVLLAIVRIPQEHKAAALMALIAVIAPLGWGHTYVMVLPLVMLQVIAMRNASAIVAVITTVCVLAFVVPAGRRLPIDFMPNWLENLVYSRYLLATMLLIVISTNRVVGQKTESRTSTSA